MARIKLLTVSAISFFLGACVMVGYHVYDIKKYRSESQVALSMRPLVVQSGKCKRTKCKKYASQFVDLHISVLYSTLPKLMLF